MVLNQQHNRVWGEDWDWDCLGHHPGTEWEAACAASVWVGNGVVVGQWATTGTRRMTMTTSSSCSTAHSMHLRVRAVQRWFWGGRCGFGCRRGCGCRGVPGLDWGGGVWGVSCEGPGALWQGWGLTMWCAPPLLLLPPCFLFSHLPSPFYLPQLLSFSPCVYVQGRRRLIGLTWWWWWWKKESAAGLFDSTSNSFQAKRFCQFWPIPPSNRS